MARKKRRKGGRQPAALRRYWATHRRRGGGGSRKKRRVATRGGFSRAGTRARPHRPRLLGSPGHFRSSDASPWHGYRVNPHLLREVGMAYGNPRHRRRHYRHNPGMMADVQRVWTHPMDTLLDGTLGTVSAYLTISIPNWLLPYPGADIMSRVIRAVSRVAAGGLVYALLSPLAAGSRDAIRAGAAIGAIGSTIFDFMGTRLIVGANDTGQTPLALIAPLTGGFTATPATVGAYARLGAYSAPMLAAARGGRVTTLGAPAQFPARAVVGHNLF